MWSENISNPIYIECDTMYRSKVCIQEFWYFVPGLDIQPEQSENDNPARKKAVAGCKTPRVIFPAHWCKSMPQWLRLIGVIQFPHGAEILSAARWPFAWHWARQCTDMSAFILLHSLLFIYFGFRQWRSRIDRVLNLNMNIRHPLRLFRALGVGPAPRLGHMCWPCAWTWL